MNGDGKANLDIRLEGERLSSVHDVVQETLDKQQREHGDWVAHRHDAPSIPSRTVAWKDIELQDALAIPLKRRYPKGLFQHQTRAIEHVLDRQNVVVTTHTSSGKSLIYTIPVADALLNSDEATVLLCYPQKALANDQLVKFHDILPEILSLADRALRPNQVSRYDGGTPQDERPAIRESVRILLTNPDMLHASVLAWHEKLWGRFLKNLRCIVLDEAHEYRGTFGSNVAMIMRRLFLVCGRYGSHPQIIATSATMSDPVAHLQTLTGREFELVGPEHDGSGQGGRSFWIVKPGAHTFQLARSLMRDFVDTDRSVIAFCMSRSTAEQLAADFTDEDRRIAVYKAGLLQERRGEIEDGLRTGRMSGGA